MVVAGRAKSEVNERNENEMHRWNSCTDGIFAYDRPQVNWNGHSMEHHLEARDVFDQRESPQMGKAICLCLIRETTASTSSLQMVSTSNVCGKISTNVELVQEESVIAKKYLVSTLLHTNSSEAVI